MPANVLHYATDILYCSHECATAAGVSPDDQEEFSAEEFERRTRAEWEPNGSPYSYRCPECGLPLHGSE